MDQSRAPLLEALERAAASQALRLHTPTHHGLVDPAYAAMMGKAALHRDLTELEETDDLRDPQGAIAQAQELAAAHFGAARTWFLVGGASAGNLAALLAIRASVGPGPEPGQGHGLGPGPEPGQGHGLGPGPGIGNQVLVSRNAHVSVVNGLVLADLDPVWIPVPWDADWEVAGCPTPEAVEMAVAAHPGAGAVVVTSPTYFGDAADLAGIRAAAGKRILVVDEAHGAHIPRALAAGADIVVHSAHKGLTGPTQGGYLHLGKTGRVAPEAISAALRLIQSTSPSYWLLAGLDAARRMAAAKRPDSANGGVRRALREAGLAVRNSADASRLLLRVPDGAAAEAALAANGIVVEAALPDAVLLLLGYDELLSNQVIEISDKILGLVNATRKQIRGVGKAVALPERVMAPRRAALGPSERISLPEAAGRICAEGVCPYPPGVPAIIPGERFSPAIVDFLARHAPDVREVSVVREDAAIDLAARRSR